MTFDFNSVLHAFGVPPLPHHHFEVLPKQSVGPIAFGMHRDVVGKAFSYNFTSFFKNPDDQIRSDRCEHVGLTVHYDSYACVRVIEIDTFQRERVSVSIFGQSLQGLTIRQAVKLIRTRAGAPAKNSVGYYFADLCLQTYSGHPGSGSEPLEAIFLTRR
jgi:hypothetical protein